MDLTKNELLYVDMMNAKIQGAKIFYEDDEAIALQDIHSGIYYIAATNYEAAKQAYVSINNFEVLVSHDEYCNQVIQAACGITYRNMCYHCAYLSKQLLPIEIPQGFHLDWVHEEYMDDVISMYGKNMPRLATYEYMKLCMDGGMIGIFDQDILAGFISVHRGGKSSIGMLEVKEEYRRKGLAILLEHAMINEQIKRGALPYGEVYTDNLASLSLQAKAGLSTSKEVTYWFYR